jgi:hypothetical protein
MGFIWLWMGTSDIAFVNTAIKLFFELLLAFEGERSSVEIILQKSLKEW